MTNKQISSILNNAVYHNGIGDADSPLAEDMSNYVDFGVSISAMDENTLKDFKQRIAVQIRNIVVTKLLEEKTFRMLKDSIEYGAALQRLVASDLLSTSDSHLNNLVSGRDYLDGHFYGVNVDAKIYQQVDSWKVKYSISGEDWRLFVTSAEEVRRILGIIYNTEKNTMTFYFNQLSKKLLIAMIENCNTNNRKISLLTKFNDLTGQSYTIAQIYADRKLYAYFADFVKGVIEKCKVYLQEGNKRYNDGTVLTFANYTEIETVAVSDFINDIRYIGQPIDFNAPDMKISEVSCWQTTTDAILPTLHDVTHIELDGGNIDNVVAVMYDTTAVGITNVGAGEKVTSQYIGSEDYETFFHHVSTRYYYDTRFGSLILTLD